MKVKQERKEKSVKNKSENLGAVNKKCVRHKKAENLDKTANKPTTMQTCKIFDENAQNPCNLGTTQTNSEYAVCLKNIALNYHSIKGETLAIKNISLSVKKGEFICLVGPSGCGKTTLLSIIAGILKISQGEVVLEGGENKNKNKNSYHENVGYMFQKDNLLEWRTIWKNVVLGLEINKKLTPNTIAFAESLLKKYGLFDFKDKYPRELSGGMRQRVALIRTLVLKPSILLLDEPFSALDYQTRINVCEDVSRILREENKTVIMVTHDIAEAISFADRVVVLSKRPAVVKNEHTIVLKEKSPFKRREEIGFSTYFDKIWGELTYENEKNWIFAGT